MYSSANEGRMMTWIRMTIGYAVLWIRSCIVITWRTHHGTSSVEGPELDSRGGLAGGRSCGRPNPVQRRQQRLPRRKCCGRRPLLGGLLAHGSYPAGALGFSAPTNSAQIVIDLSLQTVNPNTSIPLENSPTCNFPITHRRYFYSDGSKS